MAKTNESQLVYPSILGKLIKDPTYDPPFIELVPKKKILDKEYIEKKIETELINGTKTTKKDTYKKPIDKIGIDSNGKIIKQIILPMMPQIVDTLSGNFSQVEGMGMLAKGVDAYLKWKGFKMLSSLGGALPQEVALALKSGIFGAAVDNPHDKLLYAGHNRRTFNINYNNLKPVSEADEQILKTIINILKQESIGTYEPYVVHGPASWDVSFHSSIDTVCLKYYGCQISNFEETLGGEGEGFARMNSGFPITGFSISMTEMDYVTKKRLKRY